MRPSILFLCLWILSPVVHAAKLYVNATPNDAKIQLLSQKAEFSQGVNLSPGKYYLSVSKHGYQRYMQPVVLKDEDVKLDIVLQQTAFSLTVVATPADAQIRIMNILPKFQQGMLLPRGKYDVEVRKPGYVTQQQVVEIAEQPVNLIVTLQEVNQPQAVTTAPDTTQPTYPFMSLRHRVLL
ncbi:MAG: PEGA domain-containing protein [Thiotrichaceae bacterium]